jgi:hypothetical protein
MVIPFGSAISRFANYKNSASLLSGNASNNQLFEAFF